MNIVKVLIATMHLGIVWKQGEYDVPGAMPLGVAEKLVEIGHANVPNPIIDPLSVKAEDPAVVNVEETSTGEDEVPPVIDEAPPEPQPKRRGRPKRK